MERIITYSVFAALLAAFVILVLDKTGIRAKVEMKAPKLIAEMFGCDFCLSFWTCVVISGVLLIATGFWGFLIVPMLGAVISRAVL